MAIDCWREWQQCCTGVPRCTDAKFVFLLLQQTLYPHGSPSCPKWLQCRKASGWTSTVLFLETFQPRLPGEGQIDLSSPPIIRYCYTCLLTALICLLNLFDCCSGQVTCESVTREAWLWSIHPSSVVDWGGRRSLSQAESWCNARPLHDTSTPTQSHTLQGMFRDMVSASLKTFFQNSLSPQIRFREHFSGLCEFYKCNKSSLLDYMRIKFWFSILWCDEEAWL